MRLKGQGRRIQLTTLPLTHLWKKVAQKGESFSVQSILIGYLINLHISQGEGIFCVPTACFLSDVRAGIFGEVRIKELKMPAAKEYRI